MKAAARLAAIAIVLLVACGAAPGPATLDPRNDTCRYCRMVVSDQRLASQIVAPHEEPRFFDDLGCLKNYLDATPDLSSGAVIYVADHRTRAWVRAGDATYTRVESTAPMGSHFIAHASEASRDADPDAAKARPVAVADVLPVGHLEAR